MIKLCDTNIRKEGETGGRGEEEKRKFGDFSRNC
jgi:hypothetical protein